MTRGGGGEHLLHIEFLTPQNITGLTRNGNELNLRNGNLYCEYIIINLVVLREGNRTQPRLKTKGRRKMLLLMNEQEVEEDVVGV